MDEKLLDIGFNVDMHIDDEDVIVVATTVYDNNFYKAISTHNGIITKNSICNTLLDAIEDVQEQIKKHERNRYGISY